MSDATVPRLFGLRRPAPGARAFAVMFAIEAITRASLATVIPLQAYAILESSRDVSLAFFVVSTTGLAASFFIPALIARIGRRRVYLLGAAALVLAPVLLATLTVAGQLGGMLVRTFGAACLSIALSLYIMAFIQRRDLVRSEPLKFLFAASAWTLGPTLGVLLYARLGPWVADLFSAFCGLLLIANFLFVRIAEAPPREAARLPANPLVGIARFFAQKRLVLGWAIALGRACWWGTLMIYLPVFLVQHGKPALAGALFVSAASAMLFLTPLWGRIAARIGIRTVITAGFLWCAATALVGAALAGSPWLAATVLMLGALGGTALDTVGNIPFYRAVHAYERPQMTTIFRTNADCADLVPAALYWVLLAFLPLPFVFVACGLFMAGCALLARYLPRGM